MSVAEDRIVRRLDILIEAVKESGVRFLEMRETLLGIGMTVRQASDTLERMEKQR